MKVEEIVDGGVYRCVDGKTRYVRAIVGTPKLEIPFYVCFQEGFNIPDVASITYFAIWAEERLR
jgi:hypothetical protein